MVDAGTSYSNDDIERKNRMKMYFMFVLVLTTGMIVADDTSIVPPGFIPGNIDSYSSNLLIEPHISGDNTCGDLFPDGHSIPSVPRGTDAFSFSEVNWSPFNLYGAGNPLLGLDMVTWSGDKVMTPMDSVYLLNPDDGTKFIALPLDPSNSYPFGCYVYSSINTNDYSNSSIYYTPDIGVTWTTTTNPSGSLGRGMDADFTTGLIWETYYNTGVFSFLHQSSTGTFHDLSAYIPGQLSGLTTYDNGGCKYLVINTYSSNYAYFFDLDDNLNFLGTAEYPYPTAFYKSYGLAYSPTRDTFFWSFKNTSDYCYLIELQLSTTSLEQSTWGEIKSSF